MDVIPPGGLANGMHLPFPASHVQIAIALTVLAFLVMYAVLLWRIRSASRKRVALRCPTRDEPATVTFRVADDETRIDVVACSLPDHRDCDKRCLEVAS